MNKEIPAASSQILGWHMNSPNHDNSFHYHLVIGIILMQDHEVILPMPLTSVPDSRESKVGTHSSCSLAQSLLEGHSQ